MLLLMLCWAARGACEAEMGFMRTRRKLTSWQILRRGRALRPSVVSKQVGGGCQVLTTRQAKSARRNSWQGRLRGATWWRVKTLPRLADLEVGGGS